MGIDLENHPVDVEKEILATVDATANNVPDVPLEEKNPQIGRASCRERVC